MPGWKRKNIYTIKNVILSKLIQRLFECLPFLFEGFFTFLVALAHRSQLTVCPLGSGSTVVVRCLLHQCVPLHNKENPTFLLWHLVYSRKCSRNRVYPYSESDSFVTLVKFTFKLKTSKLNQFPIYQIAALSCFILSNGIVLDKTTWW